MSLLLARTHSRHFSDVRPKRIGAFPREEKQFSQPTRPRKWLDHVCDVLQVNHYSVRTEEAYCYWRVSLRPRAKDYDGLRKTRFVVSRVSEVA
jgi:hypothetical protein